MDKLIFLFLLLITFSSFGQKDLDINKLLWGKNRAIVNSFLRAGQKDFFFVDRKHQGQVCPEKYDSCKDETFIKFILLKTKDSKYEFTKHANCRQTRVTIDSKALQFFEDNRNQIIEDSIIEEEIFSDHSIFYSLYEFKDGSLKTYKPFCKDLVDLGRDKLTRERNQSLKFYKFFTELDNELSGLMK